MAPSLWQLVQSFLLIGLGAYGGGMVTIPLIQHEIVDKGHWLTFSEFSRLIAIAQMTPGPIAVNAATFVGFTQGGLAGAVVATGAVVLPGLALLVGLALFVDRLGEDGRGRAARWGVQLGVVSLILYATWNFGASVVVDRWSLALAVLSFGVLVGKEGKVHPIVVILTGGIAWSLLF
ncbi:MAG: chromate transporter [Candidatus Riflebacteria bacterium]|nr:chromate transporter [Candidatus Riflebacteria bacterium]